MTTKSGGTITFRATSQGPFALTVVTANGYKAAQGGNRKAIGKEDILLTIDVKENKYEGNVTLQAGSSYFILENQMDKNAELHLECFPP